jgi:antitoxin YefM
VEKLSDLPNCVIFLLSDQNNTRTLTNDFGKQPETAEKKVRMVPNTAGRPTPLDAATADTAMGRIQYIADGNNNITGVIVPIELWREIQSEKETAYLLKSETMKKRLLDAKKRKKGIPFAEARQKLEV